MERVKKLLKPSHLEGVYILFGQTATGKTAKALELAQQNDGEIINFDSRQIYQKLDIVTGKDLPENSKYQLADIKDQKSKINNKDHAIGYYEFTTRVWLYDIIDPRISFSSADYVACGEMVLVDILKRGKTPILVGGTGYYLYHLLYGVPKIDVPQNWQLRTQLSQKPVEELQFMLKERDQALFESLNESDQANPRRLIRRLEILDAGGSMDSKPDQITLPARLSNLVGSTLPTLELNPLPFFHCSSAAKQGLIRTRVLKRIEEGAIEETQKLLEEGYTARDPGLNAIGYAQIIAYLENKITREQMIELWITKEMQYSKRQKTFFTKLFPDAVK
jgi:tRNA dimethylallyltransferase